MCTDNIEDWSKGSCRGTEQNYMDKDYEIISETLSSITKLKNKNFQDSKDAAIMPQHYVVMIHMLG